MHTNLSMSPMTPDASDDVAHLLGAFDDTEVPHLMGLRRREVFSYQGLFPHLRYFDSPHGLESLQRVFAPPRFAEFRDGLVSCPQHYDPKTWRSPADAMATRFYHWETPR